MGSRGSQWGGRLRFSESFGSAMLRASSGARHPDEQGGELKPGFSRPDDQFTVDGDFGEFSGLDARTARTCRKPDFAGGGSVWVRANVVVPPRGFHYDTGQCIGCGICNEDEVEALRVSAGHCDWAGQIDERPPNAVRTKGIRKSR